jgi:hypothetical protein
LAENREGDDCEEHYPSARGGEEDAALGPQERS